MVDMSVHTLPNIEHATKRICHLEKFENLSKSHPALKDPRVRKAIYALLDDTPKTGDDILHILASVPGKIAYILKIIEDPCVVE